jgi:hypothetical protein
MEQKMLVAQNKQLASLDRTKAAAIDPATMPPATSAVIKLLKEGVRSTHFLFPENGPIRETETWLPPFVTDTRTLEEVRDRLRNLHIALDPAPPGELLSRVMVLLAHYRVPDNSKATEYGIALDWADDLAAYPLWAIEEAARSWRRTKKFRPQICEMIGLCEDACGKLKTERKRLESVIDATELATNPVRRETRSSVRNLLKPITESSSTTTDEQDEAATASDPVTYDRGIISGPSLRTRQQPDFHQRG